MSDEEWRPVVGYEDCYEVSNLGRVRSIDRIVRWSGDKTRLCRGQLMKPRVSSSGHLNLVLTRNQVKVGRSVHRLVLEAFVGPCPAEMECRHLDDVPTNNTLSNLVWGTRIENRADMVRNNRCANARKTHCKQGHPFDEANTYRDGRRRICRACNRAAQARRYKASA